MIFRAKAGRKNNSKKEILSVSFSQVRLWKTISCILMILLVCMLFQRVAERYLASQEQELIAYRDIQSKLEDKSSCLLCGDDSRSMINYYRQFDTIGLISLNDWYMVDFSLNSDEDMATGSESYGENISSDGKTSDRWASVSGSSGQAASALTQVNTGLMHIFADTISSGHRMAMQVTWGRDLTLDTTLVEEHLCADCLRKVVDSLTISKRRYENKSPIPLCLVDFQTLELYSVQDWQTEYCIRGYWIDLQYSDDGVSIKAYC